MESIHTFAMSLEKNLPTYTIPSIIISFWENLPSLQAATYIRDETPCKTKKNIKKQQLKASLSKGERIDQN